MSREVRSVSDEATGEPVGFGERDEDIRTHTGRPNGRDRSMAL
jgi:hypothetical protein